MAADARSADDVRRDIASERERSSGSGEAETEREEAEDSSADGQPDPHSERGHLALYLEERKLELEAGEGAGMLGDVLRRRPNPVLSLLGEHVPSSPTLSRGRFRQRARLR